MENLQNRTLFFGDNLEILREKIPSECIDLIYLDPPFNSKKGYNLLYKEGLVDSPAQVQAFADTWHWTEDAQHTFEELAGLRQSKTGINQSISSLITALEKIIGHNDMLAYLVMMTIRLIELKRVLKPTGSIYLHCDPTASHYLKIVMDVVFGEKNFRNEVIWRYRRWPSKQNNFQRMHDIIFRYSKGQELIWNQLYDELSESSKKQWGGKLRVDQKTDKGTRFSIVTDKQSPGVPMSDTWEISQLSGPHKEYLGYQTQKPEALLERIIKASSNEGDWVLDPFCGCGTTVAVAEKLNRKWIGIDITTLAINIIRERLKNKFHEKRIKINVDGLPEDLSAARELAHKNRFEFEYWALHFVNAIPAQNKSKENMRGADKGIDGMVYFYKEVKEKDKQEIGTAIVQVKSGNVNRSDIATLKGDIEREKADAGVFITLEEPTKPMVEEAISVGDFEVAYGQGKGSYPKVQVLTIKELLGGKKPRLPLGWDFYHQKQAQTEAIPNHQFDLEL